MYAHREYKGSIAKCRNPTGSSFYSHSKFPVFRNWNMERFRGSWQVRQIVRGKDTLQTQTECLRDPVFHFWATLTLQLHLASSEIGKWASCYYNPEHIESYFSLSKGTQKKYPKPGCLHQCAKFYCCLSHHPCEKTRYPSPCLLPKEQLLRLCIRAPSLAQPQPWRRVWKGNMRSSSSLSRELAISSESGRP